MTDHAQDARRAEFEALAVPQVDAPYRFAAWQLGAAHEAEDAVQDTCLKAYRAFDRFERGTDFRAWLFRILVNTVTNRWRRAGRTARTVDLDLAETRAASGEGLIAVVADHPVRTELPVSRDLQAREGAAHVRRPRRGP